MGRDAQKSPWGLSDRGRGWFRYRSVSAKLLLQAACSMGFSTQLMGFFPSVFDQHPQQGGDVLFRQGAAILYAL